MGVAGRPKCWAMATMAMNLRVLAAIICDPLSETASSNRDRIIVAVQDQLTLKGVSAFQGGGEQVLGLQGLPGGETDLEVGPSRRRRA